MRELESAQISILRNNSIDNQLSTGHKLEGSPGSIQSSQAIYLRKVCSGPFMKTELPKCAETFLWYVENE